MTPASTTAIILGSVTNYGIALLAILTAVIGIGLAYLVFRFGIKRLFYDQSLEIGGYYLRKTPYAGYNRFRSKEWNIKNTM